MCQGGYDKTEDTDIPLNNKPLSKRCCVCLLKAVGKTCRGAMEVNMEKQLNFHGRISWINHSNKGMNITKLIQTMEEMVRWQKI